MSDDIKNVKDTTRTVSKSKTEAGVGCFPAEEFQARANKVREEMARTGYDALLLTSPENIYYLTGLNHQGYFAFTMLIFPLEGQPVLVARTMERRTITKQAPDVIHEGFEDTEMPEDAVERAISRMGIKKGRLGTEEGGMYFPPKILKNIQKKISTAEWGDVSDLVNSVRIIKTPVEIECVKKAAEFSNAGMNKALDAAGVGINEQDIAADTIEHMIRSGSEQPGLLPLIRSTETLPFEHLSWRNHKLLEGEGLFVELSGSYNRYHAPMSRTVYMGSASDNIHKAAEISIEGIMTVKDNLKPGVISGDVYAAWENVVQNGLGLPNYKRHHCGYTVGIGFPPSWSGGGVVQGITKNGKIEIKEGMVFHIFSWITDEALAFFVTSDTVVVTKNGAEMLTSAPRDTVVK